MNQGERRRSARPHPRRGYRSASDRSRSSPQMHVTGKRGAKGQAAPHQPSPGSRRGGPGTVGGARKHNLRGRLSSEESAPDFVRTAQPYTDHTQGLLPSVSVSPSAHRGETQVSPPHPGFPEPPNLSAGFQASSPQLNSLIFHVKPQKASPATDDRYLRCLPLSLLQAAFPWTPRHCLHSWQDGREAQCPQLALWIPLTKGWLSFLTAVTQHKMTFSKGRPSCHLSPRTQERGLQTRQLQ